MTDFAFRRETTRNLLQPNDVVGARVANIELHEFEYKGEKVEKLKWFFTVTDQENDWYGKEIQGETSTKFHPHPSCKPYHWVQALTGKAYEVEDEPLKPDQLIGLPCKIMIEHKPGKNGAVWMRVKEVIPAGAKASAAAVVREPEPNPF